MRLFPFLTALAVIAAIYFVVLEREALLSFAGVSTAAEAPAEPAVAAPDDSAEEAGERRIGVVALRSTAQPVENAVLLRGRTEAARQVEVRAETAGLIVSEPRPRGAFVNEGEVLCEIAPGTRPAALREAEARLAEAEINYTAATRLSQEGFAAETRLVAARAAFETAQAGVERAQDELAKLVMKAPFDGILESDTAELGTLMQPGGLCATIIRLDPIRLVGFVPEMQVDRINVGAAAGARLASGREVLGRVTFLSRAADPATRTFRVEVTVPNPDLSIRDGLTAEILIAAEGAQAHLVPGSALTLDGAGRLGLRLVDDTSRARFAPVSVLRDTTEGVWVTGLDENAEIIVVGQEYVNEGTLLRVTFRNGEAAGSVPLPEGLPAATDAEAEGLTEAEAQSLLRAIEEGAAGEGDDPATAQPEAAR